MNTENTETVAPRFSVKKLFLEMLQNSQENTFARVSFCKIFKNTSFYRIPPVAGFENMMSGLYFNEESYYSGENTCGNKVFLSNILQPFYFEFEQKKNVW